jgi:V/A-type H+-transporting ATPase subunit E
MSLDAIAKRIAEEASAEASALLGAAKAEREEALKAAKKDLEEEYSRDLRRLNAEAADSRSRLGYHVRREEERRVENAARRTLDAAIDAAARKLAALPDSEYLALIKATLGQCSFKGEVEVLISAADESRITQSFLSGAGGPDRSFRLSTERHDQVGGVVLRSGKISLNATFSRVAALSHETIVRELSAMVAGQG